MDKKLNNVRTPSNIEIYGDPDRWELICKASGEYWMKSTKRMKVDKGYLWQVSTEFRNKSGNVTACAESITMEYLT